MAVTPTTPALVRIADEDPISQLRQRAGTALRLGSENGTPMLDWVEAVPRILADPAGLERVEAEASQLVSRGIRHLVWAGMGGSVLTVQVLRALGFCSDRIMIHPLDSTDPAALNALLSELARLHELILPEASSVGAEAAAESTFYRTFLADVALVGVAMGMTSEEPISHLEWFAGLLQQGGLPLAEHLLVMSIPGSYLERYASSHGVPSVPLQLDGGSGTPGRLSAPATRVFLLPVALDLVARGADPGALRVILRHAWTTYSLDAAVTAPAQHRYVQLAAALADAAVDGACALYVALSPELDPLRWWMEQLMEESLGKGGKGIIVFADQPLSRAASGASPVRSGALRLCIVTETEDTSDGAFTLCEPLLGASAPEDRLAGLAATFLGLQLTMALYGYLHDIRFAGQPAVEDYKRRARELRSAGDPLQVARAACSPVTGGTLTVLPPSSATSPKAPPSSPTQMIADALTPQIRYLDLTINGELPEQWYAKVEHRLQDLGNEHLNVPVKFRRAPASYHSTEQSEMDGPAGLVSLRVLAEHQASCLLGTYDATFLRAQAVGTWMAMNAQGRTCFLLLYDAMDEALGSALCDFLDALAQAVPYSGRLEAAGAERAAHSEAKCQR